MKLCANNYTITPFNENAGRIIYDMRLAGELVYKMSETQCVKGIINTSDIVKHLKNLLHIRYSQGDRKHRVEEHTLNVTCLRKDYPEHTK